MELDPGAHMRCIRFLSKIGCDKYLEDTFRMKFGRARRRPQKYSDAWSTRLRRAWGLVRSGHMGLCTWRTSLRIRDGIWPMPYICCNYSLCSRTTRTIMKLVGHGRKLPEKYSGRSRELVPD
jgi:hypothetical protein